MKLPLMNSIKIFWEESFSYILIYGVYALIVCGIILYIENRQLESDLVFNKLLYTNVAICFLALVLFTLSLFAGGWLTQLFGGELMTFIVTVIISLVLIYVMKMFLINYFDLQFVSSRKISIITSLSLFGPFILFTGFIFALGAGFRN
jgi:hypothetical protein